MVTTRPQRPCTAPGCPNRTYGGKCSRHAKLSGQQRDHWRALYGDAWPRIRLEYLARRPQCLLCPRMATVADHHPRGIRLLIKQGNKDPHADRHLRPLCAPCHSRETAKYQPGGWNNR